MVGKYSRVVFWQNQLSHHQSPFISALAGCPGLEVVWVVERDVASSTRAGQGWPDVQAGEAKVVTGPSDAQIDALLDESPDTSVHVLSGVFFVRTVRRALVRGRRKGLALMMMSESPTPPGLQLASEKLSLGKRARFLLPLAHKALLSYAGRKMKAVLCIGRQSKEWFLQTGYTDTQVFPWAYLPPPPESASEKASSGPVRFVYLGEISHHKGVDLIVRAGLQLPAGCEVVLVGDGPMRSELQALVAEAGGQGRVSFLGFQPWQQAMDLLASADTTLVPSRYDGWGAVTSESLMRGVPVIVSDGAGSCDLVSSGLQGEIVAQGELAPLLAAMESRCLAGKLDEATRRSILDWSACLSGQSAADYFLGILAFVEGGGNKPQAPWMAQPDA